MKVYAVVKVDKADDFREWGPVFFCDYEDAKKCLKEKKEHAIEEHMGTDEYFRINTYDVFENYDEAGMHRNEFVKQVEALGLDVSYGKGFSDDLIGIDVLEHRNSGDEPKHLIASVSEMYRYDFSTLCLGILPLFKQKKLEKILEAYAATPIKERKPKRYFKYRLKSIGTNISVDNYKTQYLKVELDGAFKSCVLSGEESNSEKQRMIFVENDPLLEDAEVHLEMFDAIEVDAGGNEI